MEFWAPEHAFDVGQVITVGPIPGPDLRIVRKDGFHYWAEPTRDARREAERKAQRQRIRYLLALSSNRLATACLGAPP